MLLGQMSICHAIMRMFFTIADRKKSYLSKSNVIAKALPSFYFPILGLSSNLLV